MKAVNGHVVDPDIPALDEDGRERAKRESAGCPHCGACGLVVIDATPDSRSRSRTATATCVCLHGRWIREWHRQKNSDVLGRMPDLQHVMDGRHRDWTYSQ